MYKNNLKSLYMYFVQNTQIETVDKCFLFETEDTRMECYTHLTARMSWQRKVASTGFSGDWHILASSQSYLKIIRVTGTLKN